jgi:hypothetical protein
LIEAMVLFTAAGFVMRELNLSFDASANKNARINRAFW